MVDNVGDLLANAAEDLRVVLQELAARLVEEVDGVVDQGMQQLRSLSGQLLQRLDVLVSGSPTMQKVEHVVGVVANVTDKIASKASPIIKTVTKVGRTVLSMGQTTPGPIGSIMRGGGGALFKVGTAAQNVVSFALKIQTVAQKIVSSGGLVGALGDIVTLLLEKLDGLLSSWTSILRSRADEFANFVPDTLLRLVDGGKALASQLAEKVIRSILSGFSSVFSLVANAAQTLQRIRAGADSAVEFIASRAVVKSTLVDVGDAVVALAGLPAELADEAASAAPLFAATKALKAGLASSSSSVAALRALRQRLPALVASFDLQECVPGSPCIRDLLKDTLQTVLVESRALQEGVRAVGTFKAHMDSSGSGLLSSLNRATSLISAAKEPVQSALALFTLQGPGSGARALASGNFLAVVSGAALDFADTIVGGIRRAADFVQGVAGFLGTISRGVRSAVAAIQAFNPGQWVADRIQEVAAFVLSPLRMALEFFVTFRTTVVDSLNSVVSYIRGTAEKLVLLARDQFVKVPQLALDVLHGVQDVVNDISPARDTVEDIADGIADFAEQSRRVLGRGTPNGVIDPADLKPPCDAGDPCVHVVPRRSAVFTSLMALKYTHFWYQTFPPAFGSCQIRGYPCRGDNWHVTLPGLVEDWMPQGVEALDYRRLAVSMHGTGKNAATPSIIVVMNDDEVILKTFSLQLPDGTPYFGSVADLALDRDHGLLWVCSDAVNETAIDHVLDSIPASARQNHIMAFDWKVAEQLLSNSDPVVELTAAHGPFEVDVQANALFYDRTAFGFHGTLWVGEYYEPGDPASPAEEPGESQTSPQVGGFLNKLSGWLPPAGAGGPASTDEPLARSTPSTPLMYSYSRRVAEHHSVDGEYSADFCAQGPYGPFSVGAEDADEAEGDRHNAWLQCNMGWTVGFALGFDGLPRAATLGLTYEVDGQVVLAPNLIVQSGARAKGVMLFKQLGFVNMALTRCTYTRAGSHCTLDFHQLLPSDMSSDLSLPDPSVLSRMKTKAELEDFPVGQWVLRSGEAPASLRKRRGQDSGAEQTQEGDGASLGTATLKMRVPAGVESLALYDGTDVTFAAMVTSTGANANFDQVQRIGALTDDTVYKFLLPTVRNVNPQFTENVLYLKVRQPTPPFLLHSYVGPRCLLPIEGDPLCETRRSLGSVGAEVEDAAEPITLDELARDATHGRSLTQVVRRGSSRVLQAVGARDPKFDSAISAKNTLMSQSFVFFKLRFPLGPPIVPLFLSISAGVDVQVDLDVSLLLKEKLLAVSLIPSATPYFAAGIEIDFGIGVAGVQARVRLFSLAVVPTASLQINPAGKVDLCLQMDLALQYPSIAVEFYYAFRLCIRCYCCRKIKLGRWFSIRVPYCRIVKCKEHRFTIAKYKPFGDDWHVIPLFKVCRLPPDSTAALTSTAVVDVEQQDAVTVKTEWGGFVDQESYVREFSVALGTAPMREDIGEYYSGMDFSSFTFSSVDCPGESRPAFASVFATNTAGLRSGTTTRFSCDRTGPEVRDLEVWDTGAQAYLRYGDFQVTNATEVLLVRFKVQELAEGSRIALVEFAVGSGPGKDDVLPWSDVGYADYMEEKSPAWYYAEAGGLDLQHGKYYWVNIRTANHIGLRGWYTSHPIFIDTTGSWAGFISESGGKFGWGVEEDVSHWPSAERLSISFGPFDDAEGTPTEHFWVNVQEVQTGRMMLPGSGEGVSDHAYIGSARAWETALPPSLHLRDGLSYRWSIISQNAAGAVRESFSNGFVVDSSPPEVKSLRLSSRQVNVDYNRVERQPSTSPGDLPQPALLATQVARTTTAFISDIDLLHIMWQSWDAESGVDSILLGFGTSPGGTDLVDWTPLPQAMQQESVLRNVDWPAHTTGFVTLRVANK
ncbi:unnamed protein product, partial [Symbiodinium sp. KB8]